MKIFKILKFFLHKYLKKLNFVQKYATIEILTYLKKEGIYEMEMSEIIKQHRIALDMSQEELGKRLNPPVNKAAVQKWEKGTVENIKRTHIEQMAALFGISPCQLLSFEPINPDPTKEKICDLINRCYGKEAYSVVKMYLEMNENGRKLAFDLIRNLHSNPQNTVPERKKEKAV